MNWFFSKIKNYGVGKTIDALDNLEGPLGEWFDKSIKEFSELNGKGAAILIIDQVQFMMRAYFKIPQPEPKKQELKK